MKDVENRIHRIEPSVSEQSDLKEMLTWKLDKVMMHENGYIHSLRRITDDVGGNGTRLKSGSNGDGVEIQFYKKCQQRHKIRSHKKGPLQLCNCLAAEAK